MNLCRGHANLLCPVPILVYGLPKWALHVNYFIPTAAQCWRSSSHPRWGQGACLCVKSVWHWSRLAWPPHPCSSAFLQKPGKTWVPANVCPMVRPIKECILGTRNSMCKTTEMKVERVGGSVWWGLWMHLEECWEKKPGWGVEMKQKADCELTYYCMYYITCKLSSYSTL